MRYPLQNYEINVALPGGKVGKSWITRATDAFHEAHDRLYSYADRGEAVQLVNLRVAAIGLTHHARPDPIPNGGASPRKAAKAGRQVYFPSVGSYVDCPIYERAKLLADNAVKGPAIVEQADSTLVVPPGWTATTESQGRILMTETGGRKAKAKKR
jgi:N-methylhydantoinase A